MKHVNKFEQFINEALNPKEFDAAVKDLAYSMPNHTKYDEETCPSEEQIINAMKKYKKDLYNHSTPAQKKEAVKVVQQILTESTNEAEGTSKKELELKRIKLLNQAFKGIPNSPKQLKVRQELEEVEAELSKLNEEEGRDTLGELNEMTLGQLERIADYANMIKERMNNGEQLESWMYSQLTIALENLNSVHDAMDGNDGEVEEQ